MKIIPHFLFSCPKGFYLAIAIGVSCVSFIYLAFLQRRFFSYRLDFAILHATTLFLTLILQLNIKIEPLYYILPDMPLESSFTIDARPQNMIKQQGLRIVANSKFAQGVQGSRPEIIQPSWSYLGLPYKPL